MAIEAPLSKHKKNNFKMFMTPTLTKSSRKNTLMPTAILRAGWLSIEMHHHFLLVLECFWVRIYLQ